MTTDCGKPVKDRSGAPVPGLTCNLRAGHLGGCAMMAPEEKKLYEHYLRPPSPPEAV